MGQLIGVPIVRDHFGCRSGITAVRHPRGNLLKDGPAQQGVQYMTRDQPCDHENNEGNVASQLVTKVLQYLCRLPM